MDVQIDWNGQKKTSIPHPSVPAFRLLCEQYGIRATWNMEDKRLELEKNNLNGKKIYLISQTDEETEILNEVKHFLSETGIDVKLISNKMSLPKEGDMYLQCSIQFSKIIKRPNATLITPVKPFNKVFISSLQKELRDIGISSHVHRRVEKHITCPFVHILLTLPEKEESVLPELKEQLSISIASAILRYFQEKQPLILLASLSPELRQIFMSIVPNLHPDIPSVSPEEMSSPKNEENTLASTISNNVVPLPQQVTRAEVFFDYTAILTDKDENEWLILGNLCIKNTGNKVLRNPQVLLRLTPSNALNLGGQILPPNVVDTLGVQSSEGSKGWMYLDEDWLKKGHEKGEYRIGPIQPLEILPEEMEMHSLQISIIKSRVRGAVTVEGFVYFEEQGYQCIANNRIALSF